MFLRIKELMQMGINFRQDYSSMKSYLSMSTVKSFTKASEFDH